MTLPDLPDPPAAAPDPFPAKHGNGATGVPEALAEPEQRVRPGWTAGVVLVNVGINTAFFGPLQVLLGQQAAAFSEEGKEAILALVTGAGAAASLVANPLFGAFSDRTATRRGRRVPWVLFGATLGAAALLALAGAPDVGS